MFKRKKSEPVETPEERKAKVDATVAQNKAGTDTAREQGIERGKGFFSQDKDIQGFDPKQRQALQYEANKGIQRGTQAANRKLLGEQSQHGIMGRGGVGYAQQADLHNASMEQKNQVHRDLNVQDRDLAMKKLAAIFATGEGDAAQHQLDTQMAINALDTAEERKYQREQDKKNRKYLTRI